MGIIKIRGIVIGEKETGESGKRITVLAKGMGKITLTARGAKNTKSKLLAGAQLFSYCDFLAFEGKGFYSLTQADLIKNFYDLRMDMERLAEGVYLTELVEQTCPADMEQDEALRLLLLTLPQLEKSRTTPRLVSRIFELKYLQLSGLLSEAECMVCQEGEVAFFHRQDGAFYCREHRKTDSVALLPGVQKAMAFVCQREGREIFGFGLSDESLEQLDQILKEYLALHMGVRLKSREFGKEL